MMDDSTCFINIAIYSNSSNACLQGFPCKILSFEKTVSILIELTNRYKPRLGYNRNRND